jgi:hypothetical protein
MSYSLAGFVSPFREAVRTEDLSVALHGGPSVTYALATRRPGRGALTLWLLAAGVNIQRWTEPYADKDLDGD